ncbi:MAG: HAD family phosphatase [Burkholderiaceae bacterium]|nr:HAD family phosphatase [Burkholderiaceae bacterium]
MRSHDNHFDAVLLDLGGVLIEVDPARAMRYWERAAALTPGSLDPGCLDHDDHARFERGEIDESQWFTALAGRLGLALPQDRMVEGWNAILGERFADAALVVARAREFGPVFLFSNTNVTHARAWSARFAPLRSRFDGVFLSHEIGQRKPDPSAFAAVAARMGVAPARIRFFDDSAANVQGARRAGMQAVRVRTRADVFAGLARGPIRSEAP